MGLTGRRGAILVVAAMGLVACGGGDGSDDATGPVATSDNGTSDGATSDAGSTDAGGSALTEDDGVPLAQVDVDRLDPEVVVVVDAATDALGDPAGPEAIVLAVERGYDAGQLVANPAGLAADGTIAAAAETVAPNRPRQDVVLLPDDDDDGSGADEESLGVGPVGFRRSPVGGLGQVDIATLFMAALENGGTAPAFAAAVVSLDKSGYSLEQIVAAVLAGEQIWTQDDRCARLGLIAIRPARRDSACAASVNSVADESEEIDVAAGAPADTPAPIAVPADEPGFEPGTFVGSVVEQSGGADDEGEVLRDIIEFTAGDTLTGKVELLGYGPGPLDTDFECIYLLYEFNALPLVDAAEGRFAGDGTASAGFAEGNCGGTPPIEETVPFAATAQVVGDTLTVVITADGDEGSFTAARTGS